MTINPPSNMIEGPQPSHSPQLLPTKHFDMKNDHSSVITVKTIESFPMTMRITVNPEFAESDCVLYQDIIVIPPSSSDLSDASVHSAPASLCTNMSLGDNTFATLTVAPTEISFVQTSSQEDTENNKSPPPKQFERSASYDSLVDIDMGQEEKDTFDHIRTASAGVEFQRKHNPRLTFDHRPSFGATIDNVKWFRGSNRRPCPRGGWLTRIAKGNDGDRASPSVTGTPATSPAADVYRNSRGFTFQC